MPKIPLQIVPDLSRSKRRFQVLTIGLILILGMLLIPILIEGGAICVSNWYEVMDKPIVVKTPILDSIHARAEALREDLADFLRAESENWRWDAAILMPALAVIMVLAAALLRH